MRRGIRTILALAILGTLLATSLTGGQRVLALDQTITTCNWATFNSALAAVQADGGGTLTFDCSGTININTTLEISTTVTINGAGNEVTLYGGNARQLLNVTSSGDLTLSALTLRGGKVSNVDYGGAIHNSGGLTVSSSTFIDNGAGFGGAIFADIDSRTTISASTFTGNVAYTGGGAIFVGGSSGATILTIEKSTFSANNVQGDKTAVGGAIWADGGSTSISASTFLDNVAQGLLSSFGGTISADPPSYVEIASSILVGKSPASADTCDGTIFSNGYNLTNSSTCAFNSTGDIQSTTVNLGSLQDNGGLTETMLPGAGSDAIDAIPVSECDLTTPTDQRGVSRPQGDGCDIGAVETGAVVPVQIVAVYSDGTTTTEGSSEPITVVATGPAGISYDYGFDCNDNGVYETLSSGAGTRVSTSCSFSDDGDVTVPIQACDAADSSNCATASIDFTVSNIAPTVSAPVVRLSATPQRTQVEASTDSRARALLGTDQDTSSSSDEGVSVIASASFIDPGVLDYHGCTVDYGDGSGPQPGTVIVSHDSDSDTCIGPDHIYIDDNPSGTSHDPYTITVEVVDNAGESGTNSTIHIVNNVPPVIDSVDTLLSATDQAVTLTVAASDAGIEDVLTYYFDCDDDGVYETSGVGNAGACSLDPDAGVVTIGVQVMDDDLGEATAVVAVEPVAELCVNYLTGVVSAAGTEGCRQGSVTLPPRTDAGSWAFCISPGTGKLRWSFNDQCSPGQRLHLVPEDGPLTYCRTAHLGLLRIPADADQCSTYEIKGQIRG